MLTKRLLLGTLLLTAFVINPGCTTTGTYRDDPSRQYRIAHDECITFGHVTGSVGYYRCVEKRMGSGIEIASFSLDTKQTSFKVPPPPSLAELLGLDANEKGQVSLSAKGESENGMSSDDYTLECRTRVFTGSRFRYKICAPIAEWAAVDRKKREISDKLFRDLDDADVNTLSGDPRESTAGQMPR
jgi:hypothetical protein